MFHKPIITSLLDTDAYKLSMLQAYWKRYAGIQSEFKFVDRKNVGVGKYFPQIREQLYEAANLRFQNSELKYLQTLPHIQDDFLNFLADFKLSEKDIYIKNDGIFDLRFRGNVEKETLWEIISMAVISEVWNQNEYPDLDLISGRKNLEAKIAKLSADEWAKSMPFADFGTRRRFSKAWHEEVVQRFAKAKESKGINFVGTSNLWLAKEYGLKAIGTMGHEWLQFHQGMVHPRFSQKEALKVWSEVYSGSSQGVALTDVIGMDSFCKDFDRNMARLYDGLRHDSGCPFEWGEKAIKLYEDRGLNPKEKTIVFSDGLNIDKALSLYEKFQGRINVSFGIGTNLTNDIEGVTPLNIVVKMTTANGLPTAKISDSPGKTVCEQPYYVDYLTELKNNW